MPASTPEEYADDLDDALQWRRSELASLRSSVENLTSAEETKPYGRMLLRAGVALLYAHWEGFARQSCQAYLDYVARRRLQYRQLSPAFGMTAVQAVAERAGRDERALEELAELVAGDGSGRARVPRTGVVDTGSNLRADRLEEILARLGLDNGPFEVRKALIDQRLCDARNEIAHGKAVFPTRDSLLELQELVIGLMEELRRQLLDAVVMSRYRAAAPTST